jgi:hypothetical protein
MPPILRLEGMNINFSNNGTQLNNIQKLIFMPSNTEVGKKGSEIQKPIKESEPECHPEVFCTIWILVSHRRQKISGEHQVLKYYVH